MVFHIFTDGSALSNKKDAHAGWAFYMPQINYYECGPMTGTNNQAELRAIFNALHYFINSAITNVDQIEIYSDSQYSIKGITGVNKVNANVGEIFAIRELIGSLKTEGISVNFIYVQAHTGKNDYFSKCNEFVDKLANSSASSQ